jgi:hypothetical protein
MLKKIDTLSDGLCLKTNDGKIYWVNKTHRLYSKKIKEFYSCYKSDNIKNPIGIPVCSTIMEFILRYMSHKELLPPTAPLIDLHLFYQMSKTKLNDEKTNDVDTSKFNTVKPGKNTDKVVIVKIEKPAMETNKPDDTDKMFYEYDMFHHLVKWDSDGFAIIKAHLDAALFFGMPRLVRKLQAVAAFAIEQSRVEGTFK